MKTIATPLLLLTGLLLSGPSGAQETPAPGRPAPEAAPPKPESSRPAPEAGRPAPPESRSRRPEPPRTAPERPRNPHRQAERPTAFIGVLTGPVSPELRAQLGLAEGFGLRVEEVMPDSPAQAAGVREHDVLVALDDQKLVNMDQLQALVRSKKKGDAITLTVISGGRDSRLSLTVGERLMPVEPPHDPHGHFLPFGRDHRGPELPRELQERLERYQQHIREYQERLRDRLRGGDRDTPPSRREPERRSEGRPDAGPRGRGDAPAERREVRESVSVTRSDDSGIYSLRREGHETIFTVKPKDGEERRWPLNNDRDRQAVPEALRGKLRQLEEIRAEGRPDAPARGRPEAPARAEERR